MSCPSMVVKVLAAPLPSRRPPHCSEWAYFYPRSYTGGNRGSKVQQFLPSGWQQLHEVGSPPGVRMGGGAVLVGRASTPAAGLQTRPARSALVSNLLTKGLLYNSSYRP